MNKREQGKIIEIKVCRYLQRLGYKILETNFTIRGGEIDIICKHGEKIIFVEVKSLSSDKFIQLQETITKRKVVFIIKTARVWLCKHSLSNSDWRIDFVGVLVDRYGKIVKLQHIPGGIF